VRTISKQPNCVVDYDFFKGYLFRCTAAGVPDQHSKIVDRDKHRKALGEQTDAGAVAQCGVNREKSSQD